jgi:hypothetical protein
MQKNHILFTLITITLLSACNKDLTPAQRSEIFAFKDMSDLATVEYTMSKVVKANDNKTWYKIGNRKIVMSVTAYAKAGIDLSLVKETAIDKKNGVIEIQIPPAKLISLNIPPEDIRQELTDVDVFRQPYTNEEKNALLVQAENNIKASLDSIGIVKKAEANAIFFIENFVKKLGYSKVNVQIAR